MNNYYFECKDQRRGLLIYKENEGVYICTYNYKKAIHFNKLLQALEFKYKNKIHGFNIIKLND